MTDLMNKPALESGAGRKDDQGKLEFSLIPVGPLREVVRVLMHGAVKYARDNWQKVPNARTRYYDAAQRHLTAWFDGERNDAETGLHHLAHLCCCALFLIWFDAKGAAVKPDPFKHYRATLEKLNAEQLRVEVAARLKAFNQAEDRRRSYAAIDEARQHHRLAVRELARRSEVPR